MEFKLLFLYQMAKMNPCNLLLLMTSEKLTNDAIVKGQLKDIIAVNKINRLERPYKSGSLYGKPQNCVITVKEVGPFRANKNAGDSITGGNKGRV